MIDKNKSKIATLVNEADEFEVTKKKSSNIKTSVVDEVESINTFKVDIQNSNYNNDQNIDIILLENKEEIEQTSSKHSKIKGKKIISRYIDATMVATNVQNGDALNRELLKTAKRKVKSKVSSEISKPIKATMKTLIIAPVKLIKRIIKTKILLIVGGIIGVAIIPIICLCIMASAISGVFGGNSNDAISAYENYMVEWNDKENELVNKTINENPNIEIVSNYGNRGRIDWKAVLAIVQAIFEEPSFSAEEQELLKVFEQQNLETGFYETHDVQVTQVNGMELKKLIITNNSFDDYINLLKEQTSYINDDVIENANLYYSSELLLSEFSEDFSIVFGSGSVNGGSVVNGSSDVGNTIANKAMTRIGYMYVWGGGHNDEAIRNPNWNKFDCSSLVCWSFYQSGVDIGNHTTKGLAKLGQTIKFEELQAGDILLYSNNGKYAGIHHVVIYIGGGKVVHAPQTGKPIQVRNVYKKGLYSCRRLY